MDRIQTKLLSSSFFSVFSHPATIRASGFGMYLQKQKIWNLKGKRTVTEIFIENNWNFEDSSSNDNNKKITLIKKPQIKLNI